MRGGGGRGVGKVGGDLPAQFTWFEGYGSEW